MSRRGVFSERWRYQDTELLSLLPLLRVQEMVIFCPKDPDSDWGWVYTTTSAQDTVRIEWNRESVKTRVSPFLGDRTFLLFTPPESHVNSHLCSEPGKWGELEPRSWWRHKEFLLKSHNLVRGCHFLSVPVFWQDRCYANTSNPRSCGSPSFNIRMGSSWERSKLGRICVFMHRKYCWTKRSAESLSKLSKCVAGSALWWLEKTWPWAGAIAQGFHSLPPPKKISLTVAILCLPWLEGRRLRNNLCFLYI